jgi:hypothetical protein
MVSFAMLLLIIDPTFIPHRFGILEFGFKVFCQFIKTIEQSDTTNPQSAIQNRS